MKRDVVSRLDVVLKVAERCNLACPYCYYFHQENQRHREGAALASLDTVDALCRFLLEGIEQNGIEDLFIGFHGGEPLLLPKARFRQASALLRDQLGGKVRLHFGLQTNGTLIDEEWIDIFEEFRFGVGVSVDGPQPVHDSNRPDHKGRGSYESTVAGLRRLQRAHGEGRVRVPGVLCVADPGHDGIGVVRHIIDDLGVQSLDLLLPRSGWASELQSDQRRWRSYARQVVECWLKANQRRPVVVRLFSNPLAAMLSPDAAQAMDARLANRHRIITVMADGRIGIDDNVMGLDERLSQADLNVRTATLQQFFDGALFRELDVAVRTPPEDCVSCQWLRVCRGGELYNRYSPQRGFRERSVFCESLKVIYANLARVATRNGEHTEAVADILSSRPTLTH